jgi:hypothetical protein
LTGTASSPPLNGIEAARTSVLLINHPRHKENGIYRHTNLYGFGLGPENINHEGHDQSAMRTHPAWRECSAIFTGLAEADRLLGSVYLDAAKGIALGVDGLHCASFSVTSNRLNVKLAAQLARLPRPWEHPYETSLRVAGLPEPGPYTLVLNEHVAEQVTCAELAA